MKTSNITLKWTTNKIGNPIIENIYGIQNAFFEMIERKNKKNRSIWNGGYLILKNQHVNIHEYISVPLSMTGQCTKVDGKKKFSHFLKENQNIYHKILNTKTMTDLKHILKSVKDIENINELQQKLDNFIFLKQEMESKYKKELAMEGKEIIVGHKTSFLCGEYLGMEKKQICVISGYTEPGFYSINDDLYSEKPEKKYYAEKQLIYNTETVMVPKFHQIPIQEPIISKFQSPEMDSYYETICENIILLSKRIQDANLILN